MPAAFNAPRYQVYAWLGVLTRLIAVMFWFWLINTSIQGSVIVPMLMGRSELLPDLDPAPTSAPPEYRPWALLRRWLARLARGVAAAMAESRLQGGTLVVVAVLGFIGYETWDQMLRAVPDTIRLRRGALQVRRHRPRHEARIPFYLFAVMPEICAEKMPKPGGWEAFGFLFENGKDLPVGMAKRQIGYPTVEPNCALCHTGSYRANASDVAVNVPSAPANTPISKPSSGSSTIAPATRNSPPSGDDGDQEQVPVGLLREALQPLPDHADGQKRPAQAEAGLRLAEAASATGPGPHRHLQPDQNGRLRLPG